MDDDSTCDGKCDGAGSGVYDLPDMLIVGHRGAPWAAVENTLDSFTQAVREGANMIETDFCMTKDGVAVIWHDCNPNDTVALARQAGAEGLPYMPWVPNLFTRWRRPVEELTLAELREHYDYQVSKGFTSSVFRNGERVNAHIPTLDELVEWSHTADGRRMAALFVDVKVGDGQLDLATAMAKEVLRLTNGERFHVFVSSPYESVIQTMRATIEAQDPRDGFHFMWDHEKAGALANSVRGGYDAISMGKTVLRGWNSFSQELEQVVADAPAGGISPVLVWTMDEDERLMQMIEAGVDGILTNRPSDLLRLVDRGWRDHDAALDAIQACANANKGNSSNATCIHSLSLKSPLRKEQVSARACVVGNSVARDLFGCGGLFDAVEVRFDANLANGSTIRWDGAAEKIVIGS
ncbi:MAG: hypothetical protein H0T42_27640 [Deltaproteobacteria bacterium]|nr:hypothetical protein [Deltaproteobacteria bacterium]